MSRGARGRDNISGVRGRSAVSGPRSREVLEGGRSRQVKTGPRSRITGGTGGSVPLANPPTGWEGYTPLDVTAGGDFTSLSLTTDYLIRDQVISGPNQVRLQGGRNIVIMGCERVGTPTIQTVGEGTFGFEFRDEIASVAPRTIHVEGCRIEGNLSQGMLLNCSTADVQLVNNRMFSEAAPLRFKNCDERDGTNLLARNHPDLIQSHSGFGGRIYGFNTLAIDGLTAWTGYQGLFFKQETDSELGPITMRRMDLHQGSFTGIEEDAASGIVYYGGALVWFEDAGTTYDFGDACYAEVLANSLIQDGNYFRTRLWNGSSYTTVANPGLGDLADALQPPNNSTMNGEGTAVTSNLAYASGTLFKWTPSVGNMVAAGDVGVGYVR